MYFKVAPKGWLSGTAIEGLFVNLPFMHQMAWTALLTMGVIALVSYLENKGLDDQKGITLSSNTFQTSTTFNVGAFVIMILLAVLYSVFW